MIAAVVVFLLNPTFACVSEPEFQYGDAEMRAAVEGTWDATLTFTDGSQRTLNFSFRQATGAATPYSVNPGAVGDQLFVRPAAACGSRVFVRSAAACISVSKMPLTGMFVSGDEAYRTVAISGEMEIPSLIFDERAWLTVDLGEHSLVTQNLSSDGSVSNVTIRQRAGGAILGTATLVRRPAS
ncbi:MAG TPA: hypothetical protein VFH73_24200 [Polyangia bacterium]|nr:hypothetical protein [Polyangia bacterium]